MPIAARPTMRPSRGFTLIELMIAMVVIAILAAVAFPSFMDSIRKGRRSEAFSALSSIQQAQERWRANNAAYASNLSASAPTGLNIPATTAGGYYTLSLANVTATGYQAVATPVAGKSQVKDGTCAKLGVQMNGGTVTYAANTSAGALAYANTSACWSR
ncbi:MAG: prepilin-type N-terminal cleavage/methylation domain-containing protein [Rubrivivax sp.]|jgi:type IV pilus assembly protein PilE|nr:prepilin-type N-terminal cleavage/methylation domain-containing protein [Rubrivivax sp.]